MVRSKGTKKTGFASMDMDKVQEIARMGGIAAHSKGTAHQWTSESARIAGSKGGQISAARKIADKLSRELGA